ncbi:MAG: AtpZ/AtpI family protein [Candidatus Zixiibacteriota bacterium]
MSGKEKDDPGLSGSGRPEKRPDERPRESFARDFGERVKSIGALGIIPIILAVGPIVGVLIGKFLDDKFGTSPWLTILFVIFGFIASIREMIRLLKRSNTDDDKTRNFPESQ